MPTLDDLTVEGSGSVVTAFSIDRMTIDLFQFWLEYDWLSLTIDLLKMDTRPIVSDQVTERYIRYQPFVWLDDNEKPTVTGVIAWAQMRSDVIRIEITNSGPLLDRIIAWCNWRFGITVDTKVEQKATLTPKPTDDNLTKTEKIVAGYLADNLSYAEIATQMDKNENTILSHCQHIAKKWGIRRVPEALRQEAQRRNYSHLNR